MHLFKVPLSEPSSRTLAQHPEVRAISRHHLKMGKVKLPEEFSAFVAGRSVVEYLPSIHEALKFSPCTT